MGVKALCVLKQGPHLLNTLQAGRMWKALYHRQLEDIIVSPPSSYNAVASGHGPAAAMIAGWIATATLAKSCMRLAMNLFHMSTGGGFLGEGQMHIGVLLELWWLVECCGHVCCGLMPSTITSSSSSKSLSSFSSSWLCAEQDFWACLLWNWGEVLCIFNVEYASNLCSRNSSPWGQQAVQLPSSHFP